MHKVLMLFLCYFLASSCSKNQSIEVSGIVMNGNTENPISGAVIHFEQSKLNYGTYSNVFSVLESVESNDVGFYHAELEPNSVVEYRFRASADGYFSSNDTLDRNAWRMNTDNFQEIKLYEKSVLKIHAFNQNRPGILMILYMLPNSPRCRTCCGKQTFVFDGLIDTTIFCPAYGGGIIEYETLRISGSGGQNGEGSVFMDNDTVVFNLEIQ